MYITASTVDDLLRQAIERIINKGHHIEPSKGHAREITGVLLRLSNPRARLSRTEKKRTLFSCLGETLWYLARSNRLDFIQYYIPTYSDFSDDGVTIYGAYGPRIFGLRRINQLANVVSKLRDDKDTRKAVIQIFDAKDITAHHEDVPCTCILHFLNRYGRLELVVYMRSNDAFLGLPHDIFAFTMLQEYVARSVGIEPGKYVHAVGSLHLYEKRFADAQAFLDEGFQSRLTPMPAMPQGDPSSALKVLLRAERELRQSGETDVNLESLDDYWADLVRLLTIYSHYKGRNAKTLQQTRSRMRLLKERMSSRIYDMYIDQKISARSP